MKVLIRSCFVLMLEAVAHHCVTNIIHREFQVLDQSTMSRFRFPFDCGWMSVMRMLNSISQGGDVAAKLDWRHMPCRVMLAVFSEHHGTG